MVAGLIRGDILMAGVGLRVPASFSCRSLARCIRTRGPLLGTSWPRTCSARRLRDRFSLEEVVRAAGCSVSSRSCTVRGTHVRDRCSLGRLMQPLRPERSRVDAMGRYRCKSRSDRGGSARPVLEKSRSMPLSAWPWCGRRHAFAPTLDATNTTGRYATRTAALSGGRKVSFARRRKFWAIAASVNSN